MDSESLDALEQLQLENERLACERNELAQEVRHLREQLDALVQRLYGRKSERFENPAQTDLLDLIGYEAPKPPETRPEDLERVEYTRRKPAVARGTKPLPEHLERVVVAVDPSEEERVCACCSTPMERTGEVVTEELDIVPPQFRVKQYVQGKYRCTSCMSRDVSKPLPERPIPRGRPSPTLLAFLIVSKWVDHLPLHRQEQMFQRHGVELRRSTMNDWLGQLAELLRPITQAMRRRLLASGYLQVDETPIQALDRDEATRSPSKTKTKRAKSRSKPKGKRSPQVRRCYAWSYAVPYGEVVYEITPSRSGAGPKAFLEGFEGYVQTDGYVGYDALFESSRRQRVACMAHVRRKFFESQHAAPERVERILALIGALYDIEARCREEELAPEERQNRRDAEARQVFERLGEEIEALAPIPTPASPLGKAVAYARSQWESLSRYLDDGRLEIDNNQVEQTMRPAALGRKNWLFLGSVEGGGDRAEVFYSLVQSAKRLGIEPFAYLSDVIERIASFPISRIDELTPLGWQRARAESEKQPAASAR